MRIGSIEGLIFASPSKYSTPTSLLSRPAAIVAMMVTCQVVAWTLAPILVHLAPPLDVVEGYLWGREWMIISFKHPGLPSWALEISRLATGATGWPAYIVSQLFVAATFVLVFLLGRELMGAQRSVAGTLLLAGVAYYAWPTVTFNHDIAQMPFWAGLSWVLWRAVERQATLWWLLVALCAAGALYAKLSSSLLLLTCLAWVLYDVAARHTAKTPGPWLALAGFAALVAPLATSLAHDLSPLRYASLRAASSMANGVHIFLFNVLINLAGVPLMLATAGLVGKRPYPGIARGSEHVVPVSRRARSYLVFLTLGPLALALAAALLSDSSLRAQWATPMFPLIGLLAIALTSDRFSNATLSRLTRVAIVILLTVPLAYVLVIRFHTPFPPNAGARVNWPQTEIAGRFAAIWKRETNTPLRNVTGEFWAAGLVALAAPEQPRVIDLRDPHPHLDPQRINAGGVLVVWSVERPRPSLPPHLAPPGQIRQEHFHWRYSSTLGDLAINYVIIPPRAVQP